MNLKKKNWLIGESLIDSLTNIILLPVNRKILQRYTYLYSISPNESTRDIFKTVLSEVKVVWEKRWNSY